ncbi:MAG: immune inhibitor A [Candidatus Promineifilaceae bacterium]|jgi:immune inhibitor A
MIKLEHIFYFKSLSFSMLPIPRISLQVNFERFDVSRLCSTLLFLSILFLTGCQGADDQAVDSSVEIILEPAGPRAHENLANMLAAAPPPADLAEIFGRFHTASLDGDLNEQPVFTNWQIGDTDSFFYSEQSNKTVIETTARVVYRSDALVMWLEEGARINDRDLKEAVETLENEIFPTTRSRFGSEPNPGIDGDTAIHILHLIDMGGNTIGYFSGKDEYTRTVAPFSNQREMFYINLDFVDIGKRDYFDVVSHEFEHMIHWNLDRNEETWINEGLAELSTTVNGYGGSGFLPAFLKDTDTSLTAFDYEGGDYAAAWLFMGWLSEKYGEAFIKELVNQEDNGIKGINALLLSYGHDTTFEKIYANWTVSVYALNHTIDLTNNLTDSFSFAFAAPYFQNVPEITPAVLQEGKLVQTTVGQFGSDFWQLPTISADQPLSITMTPSQQVRLIDGDPISGNWFWTTVPADFSNMHLTRQLDLSTVTRATLEYQTWFDIEDAYDYAYVAISADGGVSWDTLLTNASTDDDPQGKNLGNGITGISGELETAAWVKQSADLTPWAGNSDLLLRFEYITDDAVQNQGWALDDISIPEINWFDDIEAGSNDWHTAGFVRHTNRLPQTFIVQTIAIDSDNTATVAVHTVNAEGQYELLLSKTDNLHETILVISGSTPVTYQPAGYQLAIQPAK